MIGMNILGPVLPVYMNILGISGTMLGFITSCYFISLMIGSPIIANLGDRFGYKKFIISGLGIQAVVALLYLLTRDPWIIAMLRFVQGFLSAMVITPSLAWAGSLSRNENTASSMGIFNAFTFMGMSISPALGGYASKDMNFDKPFILMSLILFITFILCVVLLWNEKPKKSDSGQKMILKGVSALLSSRLIKSLLFCSFVMAFSQGGLISFLPVLTYKSNFTQIQTGILVSILALSIGLCLAPAGFIANKVNKRFMIISGIILMTICITALPFVSSFNALAVLGVLSGLGVAMMIPSINALVINHSRELGIGLALGLFTVSNVTGFMVGPALCGIVMDTFGINYVFFTISALFALSIIAVAIIPRSEETAN